MCGGVMSKSLIERIEKLEQGKVGKFGKLHKVDFGAGEVEVHHKMKETVGNDFWQIECEKYKDKYEKAKNLAEYLGRLIESNNESNF